MSEWTFEVKPHRRSLAPSRGTVAAVIIGLLVVVVGIGLVSASASASESHAEALVTRDVGAETASLTHQAEAIQAEYESTCGGPQVVAAEAASAGDAAAFESLGAIQDAYRVLGERNAGFVTQVEAFTGWLTDFGGFVGGAGDAVAQTVLDLVHLGDIEGAVTEMSKAEVTP